MAITLPDVSVDKLDAVSTLPSKVRTVEPAKSPYQPLVQKSLDDNEPKAFPGEYSLTAQGDSKTSEFTAITRELGRAARQMGLRVKTRKIVNKDNPDMVRIVFSTFRDDKSAAQDTRTENSAPVAKATAQPSTQNAPANGEAPRKVTQPAAQPARSNR